MTRLSVIAAVLLIVCGCARTWEPPGGGTPKGCIESTELAFPLASTLGLSSHVPGGDSPASVARREFEVGEWPRLGAVQIRTDLTWSRIEPEQGTFDFAGPDRVLDAIEGAGSELLGLLAYGNSWANADGSGGNRPPDDVADFGAYAAAVAERYRGRVRQYEIWNEQNIGMRFWRPEEDPAGYAELLVEASGRIRGVDPDALVSFGGVFTPGILNTPGEQYIREVHAALPDLGDWIDALAFHPYRYPFTAPEHETDAQPSLPSTLCSMRALADEVGGPELALWITELGWHTAIDAPVTGPDPDGQAVYLVRSTLMSLAHGVERYLWYTFRDSGLDDWDQEQMFGLYGYDADPTVPPEAVAKPAAHAFATLSAILADHVRIVDRSEELGLDADTWAYGVDGGAGPAVTALWTVGDERDVMLPANGGALLRDMVGGESELVAVDGAWTVRVTGEPVYVVQVP